MLRQAGLEGVSVPQFAGAVAGAGLLATAVAGAVLGPGLPALALGALAASAPVAAWRSRRSAARAAARDHWPRLIEELRILTGPMGRPIPQALIEAGLRGPDELRPAFLAAQREWALSTDFERTVAALKDRLADPTADATCETLLVINEVGGDLDRRLHALAEDRRQDLQDRRESDARHAGARVARWFVILVPAGMALAGLNVGEGAAAFRAGPAQLVVVTALTMVVVCWWWAGRIMRLPAEDRVFDR
jgi:tight adherence protein B